ncbi:MAG: hypothetical protein R6X06_09580 [Gammaproteobacteria bacterium]
MDEDHYRQTYAQINDLRCVFEKSLQSRLSSCSQSHRFCLADREGIACQLALGNKRCTTLLGLIRHNANFALGRARIESALPHNQEIRVQNGGLLGIQRLLTNATTASPPAEPSISDIHELITQAIETFGSLESLPFDEIVKRIVSYEIKKRRRSG